MSHQPYVWGSPKPIEFKDHMELGDSKFTRELFKKSKELEWLESGGWWKVNDIWLTKDFMPRPTKTTLPLNFIPFHTQITRDKINYRAPLLSLIERLIDRTLVASLRYDDQTSIMMTAPTFLTDKRYSNGYIFMIILINAFSQGGMYEGLIRHRLEWMPQVSVTHKDLFRIWDDLILEVSTW